MEDAGASYEWYDSNLIFDPLLISAELGTEAKIMFQKLRKYSLKFNISRIN